MAIRDLPIKTKLFVSITGTVAVLLLVTEVFFAVYNWFNYRDTLAKNLVAVNEVFGLNTAAALSFNDADAASEALSSLRAMQEVLKACVYTRNGDSHVLFAHYYRDSNVTPCPPRPQEGRHMGTDRIAQWRDISLDDERLGGLYLERELTDLWATTRFDALVMLIATVISLVLAVMISTWILAIIGAPIVALLNTVRNVSSTGDYSHRAERHGDDEIGELITNFNEMLRQIELRDDSLASAQEELNMRVQQADLANIELRKVVENLNATRKQLVDTEKMASLGGLVAGVAHEINTPVGVSVTAASTLHSVTRTTDQRYAEGKLTNSDLQNYFTHCKESSDIILANLQRAADLIQSFKQVAVDQTNFERRQFNVKKYLEDTLLSLNPNIRQTKVSVNVSCDEDIEINSVPGAISQIFTNLLMNSMIHGYNKDEKGTISIAVSRVDAEGMVKISYRDDGCGMSEDIRDRIFEPFFTTKRGSGGSGLGMHIVFNLVTQRLKGTVEVNSAPGQGTEVLLTLPAQLP
ncbi:HAMP domain-containing protein [Spongiibacter sp. KMU-166]|uniref:histidine kinase n=1 Tax=Spongiibacter thalassae TaxID=2721624 RepID=A0ABX1GHI5_9GAMM|nr:ATP-binding protein [Spongiibacter thalassae]NKI17664.1 HAMP domain-containing protein [Spongiibacter thalassae]